MHVCASRNPEPPHLPSLCDVPFLLFLSLIISQDKTCASSADPAREYTRAGPWTLGHPVVALARQIVGMLHFSLSHHAMVEWTLALLLIPTPLIYQ